MHPLIRCVRPLTWSLLSSAVWLRTARSYKVPFSSTSLTAATMQARLQKLQDIIGEDPGDRGMRELIVEGDFVAAAQLLGGLDPPQSIVVVSGFPCCVDHTPPTETDGPPGAAALVQAALALGHSVTLVVDECNRDVFAAAVEHLQSLTNFTMECFPAQLSDDDEKRLQSLIDKTQLLLSCERTGPGADGQCYTMRGIDMTARGLIAPLHRLVTKNTPFIGIGDGGNELGMGKVIDRIRSSTKINKGDEIGCVVAADYLISASVSNWGGYALAAGAALARASKEASDESELESLVQEWVKKCVPDEQQEIDLLNRCVAKGCRDGVSGRMEATVDGMPLETSLQCLRDLRAAALQK